MINMIDTPRERVVVIPERPADVDVSQRILRGVRFVTRAIASDGGIVMPDGMRTDIFAKAPEILARHAQAKNDATAQNIGRALEIRTTERFGEVDVQFADTELGRDYAYLYGVNAGREVYARGWSFGWEDAKVESWGLAKAIRYCGDDYDADLVPKKVLRNRSVWVATRSVLTEISATPKRADLNALTRAHKEAGIREAGVLIHEMQLDEALETICELRREHELDLQRIAELERDARALRGEDPSPAALGDSEGLVRELSQLRDWVRNQRSK